MFTGLVEEVGVIERVEAVPGGRRLWIACRRVVEDARVGDSIAVSGCCLTAVAVSERGFAVEAVPETLARTTIGGWSPGTRVNLERSLRLDQRLGGHLMQGHVDGVGEVVAAAGEGEGRRVTIALPGPLARFVAEKGSLAVDGVSLTVAGVGQGRCDVALIPHTLAVTTADEWTSARRVHLEVDVIARYVGRWLEGAETTGRTA